METNDIQIEQLYKTLPRTLQMVIDFYQAFDKEINFTTNEKRYTIEMLKRVWEMFQFGDIKPCEADLKTPTDLWLKAMQIGVMRYGEKNFLNDKIVTIQMVKEAGMLNQPLEINGQKVLEPRDIYITRFLKMSRPASMH